MTALGWGLVALAYVLGFASYWAYLFGLGVVRGAVVDDHAAGGEPRSQLFVEARVMAQLQAERWRARGYSDAYILEVLAQAMQHELDADGGPS